MALHTTAFLLDPALPRARGSYASSRALLPGLIPVVFGIGGLGAVRGTVKIKGTPDYPTHRLVRLHRESDGKPLAETWSDSITGDYEFLGLSPLLRYTVVTYDHTHIFRAVVADNLIPET